MNCTGMRYKALRVRGLVIAALVVALMAGPAGISGVYAIDDGAQDFGASTRNAPQEEEASEPEPGLSYLFAVYMITWAAFFGYAFFMSRRQRDMQREVDALKAALAEKERASQGEDQGRRVVGP